MVEQIGREGIGDNPGPFRRINLENGWLEWRWGPASTVEIVNIEVDNSVRRTGVGRRLLEELFRQVPTAKTVYAITRTDNLIAQEWYEAMGFVPLAVLRRFYDPTERKADAIMFGRSPGRIKG